MKLLSRQEFLNESKFDKVFGLSDAEKIINFLEEHGFACKQDGTNVITTDYEIDWQEPEKNWLVFNRHTGIVLSVPLNTYNELEKEIKRIFDIDESNKIDDETLPKELTIFNDKMGIDLEWVRTDSPLILAYHKQWEITYNPEDKKHSFTISSDDNHMKINYSDIDKVIKKINEAKFDKLFKTNYDFEGDYKDFQKDHNPPISIEYVDFLAQKYPEIKDSLYDLHDKWKKQAKITLNAYLKQYLNEAKFDKLFKTDLPDELEKFIKLMDWQPDFEPIEDRPESYFSEENGWQVDFDPTQNEPFHINRKSDNSGNIFKTAKNAFDWIVRVNNIKSQ